MSKKLQCQNCHQAEFDEALYEYVGEILCRPCLVARLYESNVPCEFIGWCNDKTYPNKDQKIADLKAENEKLKKENRRLNRQMDTANEIDQTTFNEMQQQLKTNTHEVCEKIRELAKKQAEELHYDYTDLLDDIFDQIEKRRKYK